MRGIGAALALGAVVALAAMALSGGSGTDPPIPRGFPGALPAFLQGGATSPAERSAAVRSDRRWLRRSRPLSPATPAWARRMHARSLLVLRALVDRRTGAALAGARAGWAYVWPRDAGAVAIALASAGYRPEAGRIVNLLRRLDLGATARFQRAGEPVEGRDAQGDAAGWVAAAEREVRLGAPTGRGRDAGREGGWPLAHGWRDRAD